MILLFVAVEKHNIFVMFKMKIKRSTLNVFLSTIKLTEIDELM